MAIPTDIYTPTKMNKIAYHLPSKENKKKNVVNHPSKDRGLLMLSLLLLYTQIHFKQDN